MMHEIEGGNLRGGMERVEAQSKLDKHSVNLMASTPTCKLWAFPNMISSRKVLKTVEMPVEVIKQCLATPRPGSSRFR